MLILSLRFRSIKGFLNCNDEKKDVRSVLLQGCDHTWGHVSLSWKTMWVSFPKSRSVSHVIAKWLIDPGPVSDSNAL